MANKKYNKAYRHSKLGFLRKLYARMKARTRGKHTKNPEIYLGLELLPIDDFLNWSQNNTDFINLFDQWKQKNYDIRFTPSVDRIDDNKGYSLDNIQWLTHKDNSIKAINKRYKK